MSIPNIRVKSLRRGIPSGYVLGRSSSGSGQVELLPMAKVAGAQVAAAGGAGGGSGVTRLSGLFDVAIASPADGQVLTYSSASGKWVNLGSSAGQWTTVALNATGTTSVFGWGTNPIFLSSSTYPITAGDAYTVRARWDFDSTSTHLQGLLLALSDLSAGYTWTWQSDGNLVIQRWSGGSSVLRGAGSGVVTFATGTVVIEADLVFGSASTVVMEKEWGVLPYVDTTVIPAGQSVYFGVATDAASQIHNLSIRKNP